MDTLHNSSDAAQKDKEFQTAVKDVIHSSESDSFWQRMSLKGKMTLLAIALSVTPVAIVGTVATIVAPEPVAEQSVVEPAEESVTQLRLTLMLLTGAATLVAGAIAAILAQRLTRPLLASAAAAQRLGQGQLDTRLAVEGQDELATLNASLNQMAGRLQSLLAEKDIVQQQQIALETERTRQQDAEVRIARLMADVAQAHKAQQDSVLTQILTEVRETLSADRVVIYRIYADGSGRVTTESVLPQWPRAIEDKAGDPCIPEELLQVYKKGRVLPTYNVFAADFHPDHLQLMQRLQIKSNLVTPILQGNNLYGLLIAHHCASAHNWQPSEIDFLVQVANQLGVSLNAFRLVEKKQLEAERERQIAQQNKLVTDLQGRIVSDIAQGRESEGLDSYLFELNQLMEKARTDIQADRVVIYQFDRNWKGTVIAESVTKGFPQALGAQIADPCFAQGYIEKYRQGRVQATENIYEAGLTECHLKQLEPFAVKANLVTPILKRDQLVALLIAHQCAKPRQWQQTEIDYLVQLANQLGVAFSAFGILEEKQTEAKQERVLAEIANARETEELQSPLSAFTATVRASLNSDRVVVYKFGRNWRGKVIAESVAQGLPEAIFAQLDDPCFAKDNNNFVEKYRQGRVHYVENVDQANIDQCYLQQLQALEVKSNLVIPIVSGATDSTDGELFGLLIAHQCSRPRTWQSFEIDYVKDMAEKLEVALRGFVLLKLRQAEAKRERVFAQIANARATEELQSPLNDFLPDVRAILDADRVVVYKFDRDWYGKVIAESVEADLPKASEADLSDPCFADETNDFVDKYRQGRVHSIENIDQAGMNECYYKQLAALKVKSNLVVPIVSGATDSTEGELFGLLIAHQCSRPRTWQPSEIDYFKGIAEQLEIALRGFVLLGLRQAEAERERQGKERLQKELLNLLTDVEGVSSGDLTVRAELSSGEIGIIADFFNAIVESLRDLVTQVKQAATQVNSSVGENEGVIGQLATEAIEQANQISTTLNSVEQMTRSIQEVADNASQAAAVARTASTTAETGGEAMDRTVESILQLRETVAETAKKVKRLGESSQQISKVISLINQIALKTNLLAVNASIEAARAGEEGRGFAVVAEEVGELAAQSASATKEIEKIVENIQLETSQVVEAMELGTTQVVEGTKLVAQTKQSLEQIVGVSRQIDGLLQSISQATISQAQTSQSVTSLMGEISQLSGRTSDTSRQVSSSLRETVAIAQQLQTSVETFKVDDK